MVTDVISITGSALSLVGVVIAIVQIKKTRVAAEAAREAALAAQQSITRNVLLTSITTCTTALEELKVQIRNKRTETALLRVTDLMSQLNQLKSLQSDPTSVLTKVDFPEILTHLGVLRDLLERKLHQSSTVINPAQINPVLATISDQLNAWIGQHKYLTFSGGSDA